MTTPIRKVNDLYSSWATGDGVFSDLNTFDVPWKVEDASENAKIVASLNFAYHGNHSGDKNISPIVHKFIKDEVTTPRSKLADTLFIMYGEKWLKLWDVLHAEYNPLNNYDMSESETTDHTTTHTGTDTNAKTGTETVAMTGTDAVANTGNDIVLMTGTDTNAKTGSNENEVSAFNSSGYEDSQKTTLGTTDTETRNMTDTTTHNTTNTETRNMTDTTTHNTTDTITHNTTDDTDVSRTLMRSGNIGVMSSQALIDSELRLREYNYYLTVFNDIDTLLTLSIY